MGGLVRGRFQKAQGDQEQEVAQFLRLIGVPGTGAGDFLQNFSRVQGIYRGVPCTLVGMENPDLTRSVSIVLPLASPTDLKLKLQTTESVRILLGVDQVQVDAAKQAEAVDPRLLQPQEVSELVQLGVPFVLTLLQDQLTMTIYGMYDAEFYEGVLGLLLRIRQRVGALT